MRKCNLDLAPDAPWRCRTLRRFEPRLADVAWQHGSLITPPTPEEPPGLDDGTAAAVLDAAEDIVNAAGVGAMAEVELERKSSESRWRRFFRRNRG
ncbi:MAG: hypothetical protein R2715_21170 [Ilumatobacteraceae bacterium]